MESSSTSPRVTSKIFWCSTQQPRFMLRSHTKEEEDAYDVVQHRNVPKPSGVTSSVAHLVKGALGAGILSGHVGYMKAGVWVALAGNITLGLYIAYCLHILVKNAQILYRRTKVPSMSYPDVGEAALMCTNNPILMKWAKPFRYTIDAVICIDLFGSCATYQIIIAKSIKQLVENTMITDVSPAYPGYPDLRIYLAVIILPCVMICLLRHLQWLAPFSIVANGFVVLCMVLTVYYSYKNNPDFHGLIGVKDYAGFFEFCGMSVFSMSCAGVVIPVENNMKDPAKFPRTLFIGMTLIMVVSVMTSFFGYVAYLESCESPITVNFPMDLFPKILKGCIVLMIFVTHALNFWVPFNLVFHYLEKCHANEKIVFWELFYRTLFVIVIGLTAILFPSINALMGFLGTFCLSNMAFIWPNVIELLVIWKNPGLGTMNWRLWKALILITIGLVLFGAGTYVSAKELYSTASSSAENHILLKENQS